MAHLMDGPIPFLEEHPALVNLQRQIDELDKLLSQAIDDLQELCDWHEELNRRLVNKGILDSFVSLDKIFENHTSGETVNESARS